MIKAILIDADGVVLKARDKYFSQRLVEDGYNIEEGSDKEFFTNEYGAIRLGKADLKEKLQQYLPKWGWNGTVDELLEYWFGYENELNLEVIEYIQNLRNKGKKCYIVSDHSKYRADDLMNYVGLSKYFDGGFFSGYIGAIKEQREFYEYVVSKLEITQEEVIFIDDEQVNVKAADLFGIQSFLYKNMAKLKIDLSEYVS